MDYNKYEDAIMKMVHEYFSTAVLPFLGIHEQIVGQGPTEISVFLHMKAGCIIIPAKTFILMSFLPAALQRLFVRSAVVLIHTVFFLYFWRLRI